MLARFAGNAGLLPAMTIHLEVIWPRFIASATVIALLFAAGFYLDFRVDNMKKKKKE